MDDQTAVPRDVWRSAAKMARSPMASISPLHVLKTTERVLERPLVLPKTELSFAEMDWEHDFEYTRWLPRCIYVATTSENADNQIRFRATDITLHEFVDTIGVAIGSSSLHHALRQRLCNPVRWRLR